MRIEEARATVNNRSSDESSDNKIFILTKLAPRPVRIGGVPIIIEDKKWIGIVTLKLLYGPATGEFSRCYYVKTNVEIDVPNSKIFPGHIIEEKDIPYVPW